LFVLGYHGLVAFGQTTAAFGQTSSKIMKPIIFKNIYLKIISIIPISLSSYQNVYIYDSYCELLETKEQTNIIIIKK
jgi:hypothetical protein